MSRLSFVTRRAKQLQLLLRSLSFSIIRDKTRRFLLLFYSSFFFLSFFLFF